MSPNPYAPPGAEVADPIPMRPEPPRTVSNACRLIVASLFLGLVTLLPGIGVPPPEDAQVPLIWTLTMIVVFGGLTLWLAVEVMRGKSWARWAMLAYLAVGWVLGGGEFTDDFLRSPLAGMIEAICMVMEIVACALLFFGSGGKWFAELAAIRRARSEEAGP
jgi:hypothetical protein